MIRLGVIGNRDYPDLGSVLRGLLSLAPSLGVELRLEGNLRDQIGRAHV